VHCQVKIHVNYYTEIHSGISKDYNFSALCFLEFLTDFHLIRLEDKPSINFVDFIESYARHSVYSFYTFMPNQKTWSVT